MGTNKQLITAGMGAVLLTLIVIALGALTLIFSPITLHERDLMGSEILTAPSAATAQGIRLRVEAWEAMPRYNSGMGIICGIALVGAGLTGGLMYMVNYSSDEDEDKTHGNNSVS